VVGPWRTQLFGFCEPKMHFAMRPMTTFRGTKNLEKNRLPRPGRQDGPGQNGGRDFDLFKGCARGAAWGSKGGAWSCSMLISVAI
jgi:hypothetical protein